MHPFHSAALFPLPPYNVDFNVLYRCLRCQHWGGGGGDSLNTVKTAIRKFFVIYLQRSIKYAPFACVFPRCPKKLLARIVDLLLEGVEDIETNAKKGEREGSLSKSKNI